MYHIVFFFLDYTPESSPRKSTRSHKPVSYVELDDGGSNSPKVSTPTEKAPDSNGIPTDLPPIAPIERPPPQVGNNVPNTYF